MAWFDKNDKVPNDHEKLFLALLVVSCATDVSKLKAWAADVVRREPSYLQRGSAALPVEFTKGKVPVLFGPLVAAYETAQTELVRSKQTRKSCSPLTCQLDQREKSER